MTDAGADVNKRAEIRHGDRSEVCTCDCHEESQGETPLHLAAMNGRAETVVLLLACGANIDEKTWSKKTACHYALEGILYVWPVDVYGTNCKSRTTQEEDKFKQVLKILGWTGFPTEGSTSTSPDSSDD